MAQNTLKVSLYADTIINLVRKYRIPLETRITTMGGKIRGRTILYELEKNACCKGIAGELAMAFDCETRECVERVLRITVWFFYRKSNRRIRTINDFIEAYKHVITKEEYK